MKPHQPLRTVLNALIAAVIAAGALLTASCGGVPRSRALAEHIRGVYVPMFKNESFEPALEESLTRLAQEAFLMDGRIRVEGQSRADLVLVGVITDYRTRPTFFEDDEFPWRSETVAEAKVTAYDPYDYDRVYPLGTWEDITATLEYDSDTRRSGEGVEPDIKEMILKALASEIVAAVIYLPPDDLEEIEERRAEQLEVEEARRRQIQFRSTYSGR